MVRMGATDKGHGCCMDSWRQPMVKMGAAAYAV